MPVNYTHTPSVEEPSAHSNCRHPYYRFFVSLSLLLTGLCTINLATASPTVSGQRISWPDNGWYQVQRADNYQTVCEGGRYCDVASGIYTVINLSSGERFENVAVTNSSTTGFQVEGNTISWADDGWYQLQRADTYQTVCEGGTSCVVAPGSYVLINHTSGQRFTQVRVAEGAATGQITVEGSTIRWNQPGWFQVQRSDNYQTVCEGGTQCSVTPGTYNVINLTTGERFQGIDVSSGSSPDSGSPPTPFDLAVVAQDLLADLAGYPLDQLAIVVADLAHSISTNNPGFILPGSTFSTVDARFGNVITEVDHIRYNCEFGGTLVREAGVMELEDIGYGHNRSRIRLRFDQCRISQRDGLLPEATYLLQGTLLTDGRGRFGPRFGEGEGSYIWNEFSLSGDNQLEYLVHGNTRHQSISGAFVDTVYSRTASILRYQKTTSNPQDDVSLTDADFSLRQEVQSAGWYRGDSLQADGVIRNQRTAAQQVTITTESTLTRRRAVNPASDLNIPYTGQVQFIAEDGSYLFLSANSTEDPEKPYAEPIIDLDYTAATGQRFQINRVERILPAINAPNCSFTRSELTGKLECTDGGTIVIP